AGLEVDVHGRLLLLRALAPPLVEAVHRHQAPPQLQRVSELLRQRLRPRVDHPVADLLVGRPPRDQPPAHVGEHPVRALHHHRQRLRGGDVVAGGHVQRLEDQLERLLELLRRRLARDSTAHGRKATVPSRRIKVPPMAELDLVIRGATLYDGTGGPPRAGDIGIKGDRIAAVGTDRPSDRLDGQRVLDAGGLAAAPGFIDTHSHSDLRVLEQPTLDAKLRQGITLELFGQDGISVAPVKEEQVAERRRALAGLLTNPKGFWQWRSVADYLAEVANAQPAVDVAYLVPHGAVREWVMGLDDRKATDAELRQMQAVLRLSLQEGAFGLSTGLIYPPCCYCDSSELVALGEVAAVKKSPIVVHMRSESDRLLEAMDEMFEVGAKAGCHIHLSHFKIAGKNNWPKLPQVIERAAAASAKGVKVTADQYPYIAGSTMMGAILPPWVHAGGPDAALQRLADKDARERMRREMLD